MKPKKKKRTHTSFSSSLTSFSSFLTLDVLAALAGLASSSSVRSTGLRLVPEPGSFLTEAPPAFFLRPPGVLGVVAAEEPSPLPAPPLLSSLRRSFWRC